MSAVNGMSGALSSLGGSYEAANMIRGKSGQADASATGASTSSASVTVTETYAPTVTSANGQTSAPVTVTEVYSPSTGSTQSQRDMLQALVDSQIRTDAAPVYEGDTDSNDDQYAVVALGVYSANAADFQPSSAVQVSTWS